MKGCLKCNEIYEGDVPCPECGHERYLTFEEAIYLATEYIKDNQMSKEDLDDLEGVV